MAASIEKLLILKAYYLGYQISAKRVLRPTALAMIDSAIAEFKIGKDDVSKMRHFFYILLKSEVLRGSDDAKFYKKIAMELSLELNNDSYDDLIAVENSTKLSNIHEYLIAFDETSRSIDAGTGDFHPGWRLVRLGEAHNAAMNAIGLNNSEITESQYRFLHKVNLKQLLEKHGVQFKA